MMLQKSDRISACIAKHPAWDNQKIAQELRCRVCDVASARLNTSESPSGRGPGSIISVNDFLKRMDYDKMLEAAIAKHCKNKFIIEVQIRTLSGIPASVWHSVSSLEKFDDNHIPDSGKTWWSTKENVRLVQEKKRYWGIAR
jgi:hypothetical protein